MDAGNSVVIVAIPQIGDQTWAVSSEKVPHMTLCYLGDNADSIDLEQVVGYTKHLAEIFSGHLFLHVQSRGLLGDEDADVLFFDNPSWQVTRIRDLLLKNDAIRKAYDSTEQFPAFIPHLTLGYPDAPAKPIAPDDDICWVSFDRLAVWVGDFEGPTFQLQDPAYSEMAMSDKAEEFLEHYGIKGMRWGIRKKRDMGPASEDAQRSSDLRAKIKKGGVQSLSNKELQDFVTRANLERQFDSLNSGQNAGKLAKGKKALDGLMKAGKTANELFTLYNSPTGKILRTTIKNLK